MIEKIVPGGSAAKAGLEVGDRILAVDGVPAELDVAKIQAIVERAEGTKVVVELERKGARKQVTMVLRRLLAP